MKILTMNLNYYVTTFGPWEVRRELIARAIRQAQPDVLAFQAVRLDESEEGLSQAEQFQKLFPEYRSLAFQPAQTLPGGHTEGSAILARPAGVRFSHHPLALLPGTDDQNQRIILAAEPNGLTVINAHFSWVGEQAERNIAEALDFAARFNGPLVLVGDLNTPPDSPLFEPMRQSGWVDAWASLFPDQPGFTFIENGEFAKRIDYVWVKNIPLEKVKSIEVVANTPGPGGQRASDHAGLLVKLDI